MTHHHAVLLGLTAHHHHHWAIGLAVMLGLMAVTLVPGLIAVYRCNRRQATA